MTHIGTHKLCETGARLAKECRDFLTTGDGEPTKLYWHVSECDECCGVNDLHPGKDKK